MNLHELEKIRELEDNYCKNCKLKQVNRKLYNKSYAHHFCINECSVGLKIKIYGNNL